MHPLSELVPSFSVGFPKIPLDRLVVNVIIACKSALSDTSSALFLR